MVGLVSLIDEREDETVECCDSCDDIPCFDSCDCYDCVDYD